MEYFQPDDKRVKNTLDDGGVIGYPTESCFGLGCLPGHSEAIERILALKNRAPSKGLILVASTLAQLEPYIMWPAHINSAPIRNTWPGPNTWLLPARYSSPLLSGTHSTIAVRISAHPVVQALCQTAQSCLVSTSANIQDQPAARSRQELVGYFNHQLEAIIEGDLGDSQKPSTIRDALTGHTIR